MPIIIEGLPLNFDAEIIEITGKIISSYRCVQSNHALISPSKKGLYLIKISPQESASYTLKLMVQ